MASRKIQGITIEIDGNTTKLSRALENVDKVVHSTNNELKQLNSALKLDPKNTELLSQKYELLSKNIEESKKRLNTLKEAQKQMGDYSKLTDEQKENYRALSVEIAKSENAIKNMNKELKNSSNIDLSKLNTALKNIGNVCLDVAKKMAEVSAAVGGALAGVVAAGVKSYASLEQNLGGVETLYKDSADKVVENAKKAYATAGISANDYMEQVTSFSASLLQSLGGDTAKAADVADMALIDMADNANKFGTDMQSIQHAYQGFAKQNYTMLDNLKLGYGGTKTEMERLLTDAQKISGTEYNINNLSDVYNAIHVIQTELRVTGTTAKEAKETISGSISSMKAAFNNFINGSGGVSELAESIKDVIKNIVNAVKEIAPDILNGLVELAQELLPEIINLIIGMLPSLFQATTNLIQSVLDLIKTNIKPISDTVISLLMSFVNFILENLPMIIEVGLQIISALAMGIAEQIPQLIPVLIDTIFFIVDTLIDNIDLIIDAGILLILGLADGLIDAIPKILDKAPIIVENLVAAIVRNVPKLIPAALQLMLTLARGLIECIPRLLQYIPTIIKAIVDGLKDGVSQMGNVGKELMNGLMNGLKNQWNKLKESVANLGGAIIDKFKSIFGIHSPSKIMEEQIGKNLGLGVVEGIEDTVGDVEKAMRGLNYKVKTSINPIINPNAISEQMSENDDKSSQLVLNIDYEKLASAMAEQLTNVKVVMNEEPMADFVIDTVSKEVYN